MRVYSRLYNQWEYGRLYNNQWKYSKFHYSLTPESWLHIYIHIYNYIRQIMLLYNRQTQKTIINDQEWTTDPLSTVEPNHIEPLSHNYEPYSRNMIRQNETNSSSLPDLLLYQVHFNSCSQCTDCKH